MRGKPRFKYGHGFTTGYGCRIEVFGDRGDTTKRLIIGDECKLGDAVHIVANDRVVIGDNCLMASKVFISDSSHGGYAGADSNEISTPDSSPNERSMYTIPVVIGDNVWIGENACILKGVHIGDGVVVGANSVVTRSVPNDSIVVGAPARVIKRFNRELCLWEKVL